jgi:hypothetical protein
MWKTSLIIRPIDEGDGIPDSGVQGETTVYRLRKDFGIDDYTALSGRTRTSLSMQEGEVHPTLQAESAERIADFFRDLKLCHQDCDGHVPALCYASAEGLRAAAHYVLWYDHRKYDVAWIGDQLKSSDPYARRYLSFSAPVIKVANDLSEPFIGDRKSGADPGALVFLNPVRLTLDDEHATLTSSDAYPGYWFLPPWRDESHPQRLRSYFSAERLKIRADLRQLCGFDLYSRDEPAAITIQRLVDDPALRDLFLDGGQLRFDVRDDGAMDVSLAVFASNALSKFRASVARGVADSWDWVIPLIASIAADVRSIVPGGMVGTADVPLSWSVEGDEASSSRTESQPGAEIWTELEGTWHKIERIFKMLEMRDQDASRTLFELVLRPTAVMNTRVHGRALDLYCSNFWRCPALASEVFRAAWGAVALDLLNVNSSQYEMLPEQWETAYRLQCERRQGRYFVTYAGHATEELIWRWRLLFPLGTVISPRTLCLDSGERSCLNSGYVLA